MESSDLIYLDDQLHKYGNDDAVLSVSELDGFLTALVSCEREIPVEQWLPAIWAGQVPTWSAVQGERFSRKVLSLLEDIEWNLSQEGGEFEALFAEDEVDGQLYTVVEDWCHGYMRGTELCGWLDLELPEEVMEALSLIAVHTSEEGVAELEKLGDEEFEQYVDAIEPAAQGLYLHFRSQRPAAQPLRKGPQVGRNDPCPCGSGKKFKQCCLH